MGAPYLNRRHFLAALAASVVAAGAPLPIGFPKEAVKPQPSTFMEMQLRVIFADKASEARAREQMPWLFVPVSERKAQRESNRVPEEAA